MAFPHKFIKPLFIMLPSLCSRRPAPARRRRDVVGARDFPGIGRFAGSVITGYQVKDFDAARMQAARLQGRPAGRCAAAGGQDHPDRLPHRSRPLDPRSLAQFRDPADKGRIRNAARLRHRCLRRHSFTEAVDALPVPQMWVDGFDYRYFAGRKAEGGRETYASVWSARTTTKSMPSSPSPSVGAIEDKMVDAAAMAKGLRETATSRSTASISTPTSAE